MQENHTRDVATCVFNGRCGNNFFQIAQLIAYAKRHNMDYYIPESVPHAPGARPYFEVRSTGAKPSNPTLYQEPLSPNGRPFYHDIPLLPTPCFQGYWQSFKYFDWCREDILRSFNLPYQQDMRISIHVRHTDYLTLPDTFPVLTPAYYQNAISFFQGLQGHPRFLVFSDDIEYCKTEFTEERYRGCSFSFSEGNSEVEDLVAMSCCSHHIVANSSFSFVASWLNQNPAKIVACPPENRMFVLSALNEDYIPDNYVQISF